MYDKLTVNIDKSILIMPKEIHSQKFKTILITNQNLKFRAFPLDMKQIKIRKLIIKRR